MKPRSRSALNLALLLAIVATGTWWTLQFAAGGASPVRVIAASSIDVAARAPSVDMTPVARLFGDAASAPAVPSMPRLVGVIAVGGTGRGVALLALDGQPAMPVKVGEPVSESLGLAAVHADRVVVRGAGGDRVLHLPARPAATGIDIAR